MKKKIIAGVFALLTALVIVGAWILKRPVDIRNVYMKKGLTTTDYEKGQQLIQQMQDAHGGKKAWLERGEASFTQTAVWYGRKKMSHWDTLPQQFRMTSELGTDNSHLTLLNGPNKGQTWGVKEGESYTIIDGGFISNNKNKYLDKLLFKNYWFQLPFRVDEGQFIAYAGESKKPLEGDASYELVYVTWGSEEANKKFDQYILYINKETHLLEMMNFTVRDKLPSLQLTTVFDDIRTVNGFQLPHSQYVIQGNPQNRHSGMKMHENHYKDIVIE